jgi:hypothetical protein
MAIHSSLVRATLIARSEANVLVQEPPASTITPDVGHPDRMPLAVAPAAPSAKPPHFQAPR